jgi:NAD(P)-dependent dehydrogenase (short-subunit alcohol dehydrogenase family)
MALALITGGSRGIGAATAVRLARDGHDIAVAYGSGAEAAVRVAAEVRALERVFRAPGARLQRSAAPSPWSSIHAVHTVYEAVGGEDGLLRLARAWHSRVMADEVVSHAFSQGFDPAHTERLAAYWADALGGPGRCSDGS